jgi:hypothetical protein
MEVLFVLVSISSCEYYLLANIFVACSLSSSRIGVFVKLIRIVIVVNQQINNICKLKSLSAIISN